MEARIEYLSAHNTEYERNNDILTKENHQLVKTVESYEQETDKVLREKEKIKNELESKQSLKNCAKLCKKCYFKFIILF